MSKQFGFYFDAGRCVQCLACEIACKSFHQAEPGLRRRRVLDIWTGEYPRVANWNLTLSCMHCAKPACRDACPSGAIAKRESDGVVVVDRELCTGCRQCAEACPYGAPQFGADGLMQKCDLCVALLAEGLEPACVATCPSEALIAGDMEMLEKLAAENFAELLAGPTQPSCFLRSVHARMRPQEYADKFFPLAAPK